MSKGNGKNTDEKGLYSRGGIWWFAYTRAGKQFRISTGEKTLQNATRYKKRFLEELDTPAPTTIINNSSNNHLLYFVIQKFLEEKDRACRIGTVKSYEKRLKHITSFFKDDTIINDLKKIDIKNYEYYRKMNGGNEATILYELKLLKNIFNFAIENELLENNLFNNYRFTKIYKNYEPRERFLTPDECIKIIENSNEYIKRIIIFILEAGTRINETLNLYFSDIATDTSNPKKIINYVRIRKEISKNKRERFIPLTSEAMEQINKQKIDFPNSMFIFTTTKGGAYKIPPINQFKNILKKANIQDTKYLCFHALRHTFASQKLQGINYKGEPITPLRMEIISHILGHESLDFTKKVYAKFDKKILMREFLADEIDKDKNHILIK
jgi:integrase